MAVLDVLATCAHNHGMATRKLQEATFYLSLFEFTAIAQMEACVASAWLEYPGTPFLREIAWFLKHGTVLPSMHPWEQPLLREFARRLVDRGMLTPEVLDQFTSEPT